MYLCLRPYLYHTYCYMKFCSVYFSAYDLFAIMKFCYISTYSIYYLLYYTMIYSYSIVFIHILYIDIC